MEKGQGIRYLVPYKLFFSFPVVLHKPAILHQSMLMDIIQQDRFDCGT